MQACCRPVVVALLVVPVACAETAGREGEHDAAGRVEAEDGGGGLEGRDEGGVQVDGADDGGTRPEICGDRVDNDGDGMTDEDCACAVGTTRSCYSGPAGTAGVGVCLAGIQTCVSDGDVDASWGPCTGEVLPGTETCGDSRDNDCNGLTDETCACTPGTTRSCYSGPAGTAGIGDCRAGTQTCVEVTPGVPGWGSCTGEVLPGTETCGDSRDNDCNGLTDETCACTPGTTRPCYSGAAATRGVGECKDGTQTCSGTGWGACTGERLPSGEVCANGLDEDCDGVADNGCTTCTWPAIDVTACGSFPGTTCGAASTVDLSCGTPGTPEAWYVIHTPAGTWSYAVEVAPNTFTIQQWVDCEHPFCAVEAPTVGLSTGGGGPRSLHYAVEQRAGGCGSFTLSVRRAW